MPPKVMAKYVMFLYSKVLMRAHSDKKYQSTTVRLPRQVYEHAKKVINGTPGWSFNEFVVLAIEEKVRRLTEAEIDAAFAQMAQDPDYQRDAVAMAREFEKSDWEAFEPSDTVHQQSKAHGRTAQTRSR
jgi:hypothetical protein